MTKIIQMSEKFRGDGFVIENCIIKGDKKHNDATKNNLGEVIFNALSKTTEYISQINAETGKKKSFAEIKEKSTRLAAWLRKEAVGPGDVVSLCSSRHPDAEIIFCAIAFVGAIYGPIDHQADLENARHYLNPLQPRVIFTYKSKIETLQQAVALEGFACKIIAIDSNSDEKCESLNDISKSISPEEIENFQVTKVDPQKTCVLFASSGTTGTPKFIPLSHQDFIHQILQFDINSRSNNSSNVLLTYFYPGWILHMLASTRALLVRQTLIFHEEFEPHETCKIIEKYKIDTLIWETYLISRLAESDVINKYDVSCVRRIHSVGSRLFDEVRGKILKIFPNVHYIGRGLGILEVGLVTLFTEKCHNRQSEGTVVPDVHLKMVDIKTGEALGPNKSGELCINSPCMMTGYYKNPTVSRDVFDHDGWYRSGDEAYYDDNGEIVVIGRLKEIIKYREILLQPSSIELIFLTHPNIVDAAVVGIFHDADVEQPIAFVQIAQGFKVTEEDILKLTCNLEPSDIFRGRVVFTDHIPRNSNGKINRRILRERANEIYRSSLQV